MEFKLTHNKQPVFLVDMPDFRQQINDAVRFLEHLGPCATGVLRFKIASASGEEIFGHFTTRGDRANGAEPVIHTSEAWLNSWCVDVELIGQPIGYQMEAHERYMYWMDAVELAIGDDRTVALRMATVRLWELVWRTWSRALYIANPETQAEQKYWEEIKEKRGGEAQFKSEVLGTWNEYEINASASPYDL